MATEAEPTWTATLGAWQGPAAAVGLFVIVLALFPGVRNTLKRAVFKMLFKLGYNAYARTAIGHWMHRKQLESRAKKSGGEPHVSSVSKDVGDSLYRVVVVPYLDDNYGYIIVDKATGRAAIVDGADAGAIISAVNKEKVDVAWILTTHRHPDHAGGNAELAKAFPAAVVVGGAGEGVAAAAREVSDGEELELGTGTRIRAIASPCHTTHHVMFLALPASPDGAGLADTALFSGDALFSAGAGKFFEGTAKQFAQIAAAVLAMPESTLLFPGHEYTVSNLKFAQWVEPRNTSIVQKLRDAELQASCKVPSIPSTLAEERQFNPFLRSDQPAVANAAGLGPSSPAYDVLGQLRKLKDDNAHQHAA